jgi:hypothetical protein
MAVRLAALRSGRALMGTDRETIKGILIEIEFEYTEWICVA